MTLIITEVDTEKWYIGRNEFNSGNEYEISEEIAKAILNYQSLGELFLWMLNNTGGFNFNKDECGKDIKDEEKNKLYKEKAKKCSRMINFLIKEKEYEEE